MQHKSGCMLCGKELRYFDQPEEGRCVFCHGTFTTQAKCIDDHYVCDACHSASANDLIERFAVVSVSRNPFDMALALMKSPNVKMHGPEHHFLVPAVLLSAFYNTLERPDEKEGRIKKARKRAENVLGGFCGFYGDCGAAVGTGIFISVVTDATPLSNEEWRLSNLVTAQSLYMIANAGGPRCCKRNSLLALQEAVRFAKERFQVEMETTPEPLECEFHDWNKECKKADCRFYPV